MTIDIAEIRAAAEAAPKGAWRYEPCTQNVWSGNVHMVASIRGWGYFQYLPNGEAVQDATGVHIATASPATVLAMCDEIESLRNGMFNIANQSTEPAIKDFAKSYLEAKT